MTKKVISAIVIAVLLLSAYVFGGYAKAARISNNDEIRLFIGQYAEVDGLKAIESANSRLEDFAAKRKEDKYAALISFSKYLTPDELEADIKEFMLTKDIEVVEMHYGIPGETGGSISMVENSDIIAAVQFNIDTLKQDLIIEDDMSENYLFHLMTEYEAGNIGVYAIVVRGKAEDMKALKSDLNYIRVVDILYNETIELEAKKEGKKVRYTVTPQKPDHKDGVY